MREILVSQWWVRTIGELEEIQDERDSASAEVAPFPSEWVFLTHAPSPEHTHTDKHTQLLFILFAAVRNMVLSWITSWPTNNIVLIPTDTAKSSPYFSPSVKEHLNSFNTLVYPIWTGMLAQRWERFNFARNNLTLVHVSKIP